MAKILALSVLLVACAGEGAAPACDNRIEAVALCEHFAMADGSERWVALTDPAQLCEPWWDDVVAVLDSGPLGSNGECPLQNVK